MFQSANMGFPCFGIQHIVLGSCVGGFERLTKGLMGYDFTPVNKAAGDFHLGAFSWSPLLEACGYLWPFTIQGGHWYCVWGVDKRLGDSYPLIISNDGFKVTKEEAKIMARCARNFVAVQRSLPDENADQSPIGQKTITKESLIGDLAKTLSGLPLNDKWPVKIRTDFVDKYEAFAKWADKSGGFSIH